MLDSEGWTKAEAAKARELWETGKTASEIAAALGTGKTRNAVIGKLYRMKLTGINASPERKQRKKLKQLRPFGSELIRSFACCQWIDGEGHSRVFCEAPAARGKPYCEYHCSRAYVKIDPAKDPANPKRRLPE